MNKRAIAAQQFHWIFVLIAGAIILLFFISIVTSVKNNSENKIAISMVHSVDTILTGANAADNTLNVLPLPPKTSISFTCTKDFSDFAIVDTIASKQLANKIIFSREETTGREIVLFTRSVDVPFKIDNALFISDKAMRFVIVDSNFADQVIDILPVNISKVKVDTLSEIPNAVIGVEKMVIVLFDNQVLNSATINALGGRDVRIVKLNTNSLILNFGKITKQSGTYDVTWDGDSSKLIGGIDLTNTLFLGALFSENQEFYECGVRKILERTEVVLSLYAQRTTFLKEHVEDGVCQSYYDQASSEFREMKGNVHDHLTYQDIPSFFFDRAFQDYYNLLDSRTSGINRQVQLRSCPLLY